MTHRNVYLISVAFFFIFFGFGTAQQYLVILFAADGRGFLALMSLFVLYGAFLLTGIAVAKFIPMFGGLKKSLLFGALTYVLFTAGIALNSTPILLAVSVLVGIGAGFLWVSSGQIITDSSSEGSMGKNLAYQVIGQYSGNISGLYAGRYLIDIFPREGVYLVLSGCVLVGVILLLGVHPLKEEVRKKIFRPFYAVKPQMLALFPLIFGAYYLQGQVFTAMNFIIVGVLGVAFIPHVVSVLKVSNIAGSFLSGKLSDRHRKAFVLAALLAVALCGAGLFVATKEFVPLLAGAILLGFSMASIYPVCLSWLKERIPDDEYLYALGTFHIYTNVGVLAAITANLWLPLGMSFLPGAVALLLAFAGIVAFDIITKRNRDA